MQVLLPPLERHGKYVYWLFQYKIITYQNPDTSFVTDMGSMETKHVDTEGLQFWGV